MRGLSLLLGLSVTMLFACTIEPRDVDDDGGTGSSQSTGGSTSSNSAGGSTSSATASGGNMQTGCESGPLSLPIAGCAPAPPPSSGDFGQDCVDRINQFRWECQCLPPIARWTEAETCTDSQSGADQSGGGAHANFGMCSENAQNTCPDWGSEDQVIGGCLQMMWDEGPGEPFEDHGHYINMSSTTYTKVACGISEYGGDFWSNQNFSQ
jgi:hypothetical protein